MNFIETSIKYTVMNNICRMKFIVKLFKNKAENIKCTAKYKLYHHPLHTYLHIDVNLIVMSIHKLLTI